MSGHDLPMDSDGHEHAHHGAHEHDDWLHQGHGQAGGDHRAFGEALGEKPLSREGRPMLLYFDPWSGVSGDMIIAALLDADRAEGRAERELRQAISALGLEGVDLRIEHGVEHGISCTRFAVEEQKPAPLRHLADMEQIILGSSLPDKVKKKSVQAVRRLASVEAGIHGCSVEDVHFHEVGAVDTLVDIVGAFTLVAALGVEEAFVGTIPVGGGTVDTAHGRMRVPAPATARLLMGYQVVGGPEMRELTTPTGALLLGELGCLQGALPNMRLLRVGYGAGSMALSTRPNLLRVLVGERGQPVFGEEAVVELVTNLDDITPEVLSHAMEDIRSAGALDVWATPVQMKKGRPGWVLHALVAKQKEDLVTDRLFQETGTLGLRRYEPCRKVAERGSVTVIVAGRPVSVKWGQWGGRLTSVSPEYEEAARVSAETGMPLGHVMQLATSAAYSMLGDHASDAGHLLP